MFKPTETFNRALPVIAQLLAEKTGVRIEFHAGVPNTDGKTIRIPRLRVESRTEEVSVLRSLIHEAGHVRFTDFKAVEDRRMSHLVRALTNSLEDPRIEHLMARQYFGAVNYFESAFVTTLEPRLLADIPKTGADNLLCLYVLLRAQTVLLGNRFMAKCFEAARRRMAALAGSQKLAALDALIDGRFPKCRTTAQIVTLAEDTAALMCAGTAPKGKPETAKGPGLAGSRPEGKDACQSPVKAEGDAGASDAALAVWRAADENRRKVNLSWDTDRDFQTTCAAEGGAGGTAGTTYSADPFDLSELKRRGPNPEGAKAERTRALLAQSLAETAGLRRALQQLVTATRLRAARLSSAGLRVRPGALTRLTVGDARVFDRTAPVRGVSTAVHLLLDGSGSMGLQGFDLALKATLAVASILQSMPLVTVGLSLYQKKVVKILIGHGETISQNLGRIGAAESWGATPLYQALMAGAWQLTQCRETRKVLIVVTDLEVMDDLCRQTVDDLEKAGFLVIGISIGDPDFADAFRNFCCISDVRELDTALFNAVSKIFR